MADTCPVCGGTGFRVIERGSITAAERCDCAKAKRSSILFDQSQIPLLYQNASIENFELPKGNPIAEDALNRVLRTVKTYVREFPILEQQDRPGLLFIGDPGTGKTHLAVAAVREIIEKYSFEGIFFDYQNLLERIRSGYDPNSGSSDKEAYRVALEAHVLVLDDLGAHRVTEWVEDTVTSILTYRCNNRKATIATTNLSDQDALPSSNAAAASTRKDSLVDRIGMRARSRLFEMCRTIKMPAVEDYRIRRRRQVP